MRPFPVAALGWALACVACPAVLPSQQPAPAAPSYAAEPVVVRSAENVYDMNADGTGVETTTMVVTVQSEAALRQFGVIGAGFARQSQTAEFVYARVRHADGTVAQTPLEGVQEQAAPVTREAPFYSDLMFKQLPIKSLRVGDTLEWQTRTVRKVAEAPNQFWGSLNFGKDAVVLAESIEIRVPAAEKLTVWTNPEDHMKPEESDSAGKHVYRWQWKQLETTVGPEAEARKKARKDKPLTPDELKDATDGPLPDVAWTTFPSWEAVGAWYRSLEGDRMQPDADIKAKVAAITAGKTTDEERVRAVYAWVAGQIRYVGVALGIGRYQPHAASAVLDNQYGDCKDKHTLLASMLLALGLHPDAVLAGAEIRFNPDVPSPAAFNHLFTRVVVDGKETWLDTTSEVAGYQVLLPPLRDKQVLLVADSGPAKVARTPTLLPFAPQSTFAVAGALNTALTSESTMTLTYHDDMEVMLRSALRQISPANYAEFVQRMMASFGFGGTTSQVEIDHPDDPSQALVFRFHYKREKGEDWGENRVTATFGPILLPGIDEKDLPRAPLELGLQRVETSTLELKLPQGWNMEVPEATHAHSAAVNCDVTYRLQNGTLLAERKLTVLQSRVGVDQLKTYAAWYKDCGAGGVPFLQLTGSSGKVTRASAETHSNAEALRLVNKANDEIRAGQYEDAATDLASAQALNPTQRDLWGDLGAVAMHRGDHKEAMRLYAKEIDLHPESGFAYENLSRLQWLSNDRKAAVMTMDRWMKASPANAAPATQAVQLLLSTGDNAAALKQANVAAGLLSPEAKADEGFQLSLGEAQLRSGDRTAGEGTLTALLKTTSDPSRRNDASYELAKAKLDLALAEETERKVIDELAEESRSWTGDESPKLLAQKSSLLVAAWDTMGWILYQQGKADEAELWVRPAWLASQHLEVGEHLGDIELAQHHTSNAIRTYQLALATLPRTDAFGVRRTTTEPAEKELTDKLASARKQYHVTTVEDTGKELQTLRVIPLGPAKDADGTAEFQLVLSAAGVLSDTPASGGTADLEARLKAVKLTGRFPSGCDAHLVRHGFVNCHSGQCELVLQP